MSKKTSKEAAAASAATPTAPLSTEEEIIKLPCALKYFFAYCTTAWGYCRGHLAEFFAESARFKEAFVDEQITLVKAVKDLPNNSVRTSEASDARIVLVAIQQQVVGLAERLRIAITYAFKDALVAANERKLAGITDFTDVNSTDWGAASDFIATANNYLTVKAEKLVEANAIQNSFPTIFKDAGQAFDKAWADFVAKRKAANLGTQAVNDGLKQILEELNPMLALGKNIYRFDATTRKQFTTRDLLNEVRGHHPAGIGGFTTLANKPLPGVRVEIVDMLEKFAVTDARGKYEIKVAAGQYDIRFTSEDTLPLTIAKRKVTAGVTGRLNVELQPAPVVVAIVAEAPAPPTLEQQLQQLPPDPMPKAHMNGALV